MTPEDLKKMSAEYQRGYENALEAIAKSHAPQWEYDQSRGDEGDFCKGWQKACVEQGAESD